MLFCKEMYPKLKVLYMVRCILGHSTVIASCLREIWLHKILARSLRWQTTRVGKHTVNLTSPVTFSEFPL